MALLGAVPAQLVATADDLRPNIILVMSDDQGWGQTGYYDHPSLKTPHLDRMAAAGIRFDRFYAGASNCSPTRASVLTGRSNDRTGVQTHGYPLRRQERTIAQALQVRGYATGHFGKWHLNGLRGPGAPILADDPLNPAVFGFDTWVSTSNFFDRDPLLSRNGQFEAFTGDSSVIIVQEALDFMARHRDTPALAVVWFGTPHSPFVASEADMSGFATLPEAERHHLGELVAMDRAVGSLRAGLRELGVADNTLVWFNSDNGGLKHWGPKTVGGLRGFKGEVYEGGLRVPAVVEWPAHIPAGQVTDYPAVTMDIFPTIGELLGLDEAVYVEPLDGISLVPVFQGFTGRRSKPIPFRRQEGGAIIDQDWKLLCPQLPQGTFELYNLADDPAETTDLMAERPQVANRLMQLWRSFDASRLASVAGHDYPDGRVEPTPPDRGDWKFWWEVDAYQPFLDEWSSRPEYEAGIRRYREQGQTP